jgi:GAF domain-containing protein
MRIAALEACRILDTSADHAFDSLVRLAAQLLDAPMALFCLVDADREWFKARVGVELSEVPRTIAFCSHTIADPHSAFVVPDATTDRRFATNPLVTGDPHIRAYAGFPVLSREELALGTFCVLDTQPRTFTDEQIDVLRSLAGQAGTLLDLRRRVAELNDLMYSRTKQPAAPELSPAT